MTSKQCNDCHILQTKFGDDEPENPGWVRSQGIGWTRSRCNTESGGAFGCVTCHDPHQRCPRHQHRGLRGQMPHVPRLRPASPRATRRLVRPAEPALDRHSARAPSMPSKGCIAVSHAPGTDRLTPHGIDRSLHPCSSSGALSRKTVRSLLRADGRNDRLSVPHGDRPARKASGSRPIRRLSPHPAQSEAADRGRTDSFRRRSAGPPAGARRHGS